jgi:hypothetical protein
VNFNALLKTFAVVLTVGVPSVALADHPRYTPPVDSHVHGHDCRHDAPPPPVARGRYQQGRYELRSVPRWVEGRFDRIWVPQTCHQNRWGRTKCRGGYYDSRWVPGHYQHAQEWVWVPAYAGGIRVGFNARF